jgi:exonuclease VII small subunit
LATRSSPLVVASRRRRGWRRPSPAIGKRSRNIPGRAFPSTGPPRRRNLGIALTNVRERESGTARLEEAVSAYRAALTEYSRERVPLNWVNAQRGLGSALLDLDGRESGSGQLEQAVAAYREALNEQTRERMALEWAATRNSSTMR